MIEHRGASAIENHRVPGTGHTEQTFLIGEHIYLRPIEAADW